ncbi:uncharacterized protein LOC119838026 [Zerene cesonia]|uniref:uncharacterized protein LOC119838026 n=1 Tax=Zerene cesonia TaxID=33412 RepID=UPI0018E4DDF9|nr:uncharacterized protein LOC119838026 [Zerene cesonia]
MFMGGSDHYAEEPPARLPEMDVKPTDEGVLWGALGVLTRLVWIFGICPIRRSPKVGVSKWQSFYGRYVLLTILRAFLKDSAAAFAFLMISTYMLFLAILFVVRIRVALVAIIEELKTLLLYSDAEHKAEADNKKIILHNNFVSTEYRDMIDGSGRQLEGNKIEVSRKIRNLALSYSSVCEVIEIVNDTTWHILSLWIVSGILGLMTAAVIIGDLSVNAEALAPTVIQLIWCANVVAKFIILSEPCHSTHEAITLTRIHLIKLQKKYRYDDGTTNELKIFFLLTVMNKPKISPLKSYTIDRLLAVKIIGCAITYFMAVIQLRLKTSQLNYNLK